MVRCTTLNVLGAGPNCASLAVDTWKPEKTILNVGENLNFIIKSGSPNSDFRVFSGDILTFFKTLIEGKTDANGCYTGVIPAQAAGVYSIQICYPVLGVCVTSFSPIDITWKATTTDCSLLSVNTWKPEKTILNAGENLNFIIKSGAPNSFFRVFSGDILTIFKTLIEGTTDANGCYTGVIPAQEAGTYSIQICYPVLGVCVSAFSPISITWKAATTDCASLAVDTWKPATVNPASGASVLVTVRSGSPNSHFLLFVDKGVLGYDTIVDATTDAQGCWSGNIPPQADGTYNFKLCYPVLGVCTTSYYPTTMTWGAKPTDWATTALYIGGALAAAYIIGNLLKGD